MIVDVAQRWRARRPVFVVPVGEWRPRAWDVAPIADDTTARAFVETHHYSRSYPAARRRFGLYHRGALCGVAVFSTPARREALKPFPLDAAMELGRFVLTDECPFNAETWMLARCLDALRAEGLAGVVSFSDPFPRTTADGETIFAGHVGQIYAASNATFLGRSHADTLHMLPDGTVFSRRALSKIRARERGWRYAVAQLVAAGASAPGDDLAAWLPTALAQTTRKVRHPGNFKYAIPLTRSARKALPVSRPYPTFGGFHVSAQ